MKKYLVLLGIAGSLAGRLDLSAASYTVVDVNFPSPPILIAAGSSHDGTFLLSYPPDEEVVTARALFGVQNPGFTGDFGNSDSISFDIALDGTFFAGANNLYTGSPYAFFGGEVSLTLLNDNMLAYSVRATANDVKLIRAQLDFTTGPKSQGVPDGGATLILLGSSLLGMGFIGRRHFSMAS